MTKHDKRLLRFLSMPRDFTWEELVALMSHFGFVYSCPNGGSHGEFYNSVLDRTISPATRPHGGSNSIPKYQMKQYKAALIDCGCIPPEEDL